MQRLPAIAELFHRAGAEILDQHVGLVEEPLEDGAVGLGLEVERDRLLAAVDRGEIGRFAVAEGTVFARVVALARRLDLDHARAHLGHQHGAIGPGEDARQIDDENARKRPCGGHRDAFHRSTDRRPLTASRRAAAIACAAARGCGMVAAMIERALSLPRAARLLSHGLCRMGPGGRAHHRLRPRPHPQRPRFRRARRGAGARCPHRLPRHAGPRQERIADPCRGLRLSDLSRRRRRAAGAARGERGRLGRHLDGRHHRHAAGGAAGNARSAASCSTTSARSLPRDGLRRLVELCRARSELRRPAGARGGAAPGRGAVRPAVGRAIGTISRRYSARRRADGTLGWAYDPRIGDALRGGEPKRRRSLGRNGTRSRCRRWSCAARNPTSCGTTTPSP